MVQKYNFPQQTQIGNVGDPSLAQDAATKAYADTKNINAYTQSQTLTALSTLILGAAVGTTSLTVAGNQTINLPDGTQVQFPDDTTNTRYSVSGAALNGANTTFTISPALSAATGARNVGAAISYYPEDTPRQITNLVAGNNVTFAGAGAGLIISSTSGGGGSTTLQGLTDVQITEPTYSQVGTFTVTSLTSNSVVFSASVIGFLNVGDFIRGSNTAGAAALKVIFVLNNSAEFASDPASFFAVGNSCYRLTDGFDGNLLTWSSSANRWIAVKNSAAIPLDGITWVANNRNVYTTNINTPIITATVTTNITTLTNNWTFATATLPGLVSYDEIVLVDAFGRFATGTYISASDAGGSFAILSTPLVDRISGGGWTVNFSYVASVRRGTDALQRYAGAGDVVYSAADNVEEYPSLLAYGQRYSATATFNQPQNPNTALAGTITITGFPAGGALKFSVNEPVLVESADGAWNVSEIYVLSISGTSDPSAIYTMSAGQFNSRSTLAAGSYPVIVTLLQASGVGSINSLKKNVTIAAGTGISINQSGQTINIVNNKRPRGEMR